MITIEENKTLKRVLDNEKMESKIRTMYRVITYDKCKNHVIRSKDVRMFGLSRVDLLPSFLEAYYHYRFEDENGVNPLIKELEDRLKIETKKRKELEGEIETIINRSFIERLLNTDL